EIKPLPSSSKFLPFNQEFEIARNTLIQQGYSECYSSSLVSNKEELNSFVHSQLEGFDSVKMLNPLSAECSELRTSLLDNLLKAASRNFKRKQNNCKLFELGKVYGFDASVERSDEKETQAIEKETLCFINSQKSLEVNWQGNKDNAVNFFQLKAISEKLFEKRGKLEFEALENANSLKLLHPKVSAKIKFNGKEIGFIGQLHPIICKKYELPENTFVTEIIIEALIQSAKKVKIKSLNDHPVLHRDFTIDIDGHEESGLIHSIIEKRVQKIKLPDLKEVKFLSHFKQAQSNRTSLSYRLVFQSDEGKQLLGEVINTKISNLKETFQKEFAGVSFRE
ncbi:MAG TPA: hypothetical protein V6C96_02880, partial [Vampirovibrionales bacterium]